MMRRNIAKFLIAGTVAIFVTAGWFGPENGLFPPGLRGAAAQSSASVEGFRSARFGMSLETLYEALKKDFGVDKEKVTSTRNAIEKTTSLLITIDDIIPQSGQAIIAYIFGFESNKLIQINVIWNNEEKTLASAENLVATGNILRNYFVAQGFPEEGRLMNQRLTDGSIVMFRGIDAKGRATVLQLLVEQGAVLEDGTAGDSKVASLTLSYILDPIAPDIYKINEGDF